MTLADAQTSPFRNIITRSLGTAATVDSDVFTHPLQEGDTLLLCSDGLSGHLEPEEMQEILSAQSPSSAALALVDMANDRGGRDNITALVLSVREISPLEISAEMSAPMESGKDKEKTKAEKTSLWGRRK